MVRAYPVVKMTSSTHNKENISLTPDEMEVLRHIGGQVPGPRHTLMLMPDGKITKAMGRLAEKGLAESTGFVQRIGGNELLRVRLTGKGWVMFNGLRDEDR